MEAGRCFDIRHEEDFEREAMDVFRFQSQHVPVYRDYLKLLGVDPAGVAHWTDIPFLPISCFKSHEVLAAGKSAAITFTSSGTGGQVPSRHLVADAGLYRQSFGNCFNRFYGRVEEMAVLALLPSYLERGGSSLVYMCEQLIAESQHPMSGFYLHNYQALHQALEALQAKNHKVLLIGVSYALLDFFTLYPMHFPELILMETGGMKGRRQELTRAALHAHLREGSGVSAVNSEYGMTELLSQAYAAEAGLFVCPPWMRIRVREVNDPFSFCPPGKSGGLNIIDLANAWSCAFIETSDLGVAYQDGRFEVLGRYDYAEQRGCSLMLL